MSAYPKSIQQYSEAEHIICVVQGFIGRILQKGLGLWAKWQCSDNRFISVLNERSVAKGYICECVFPRQYQGFDRMSICITNIILSLSLPALL